MKPIGHLVSSLAGAGIVYGFLGNFLSSIIFFISSFLIDLDHIFDYAKQYGLRNFTVGDFLDCCEELKINRAFLILHSFEFILILWIIITIYKLNIIWISLALGVTFHLIIDQFTNRTVSLAYFFIYRWTKRFSAQEIFLPLKIKD